MDRHKRDEPEFPHISSPPKESQSKKKKPENVSTIQMAEPEAESEKPKLALPDVGKAFGFTAPSPEDSIQFISTMEEAYDWDTGKQIEIPEEEVDTLLFGREDWQRGRPEEMFDGRDSVGIRKVIVDPSVPPRVTMESSAEQWKCHKCHKQFEAVQMLWTHIDSCNQRVGLPSVPPVRQFVTGRYDGDVDEDGSPSGLDVVYVNPRRRYPWNWGADHGQEDDPFTATEYVPTNMTFEQQMEAALRASQNITVAEEKDKKFEEETLLAIEMSVNETSPEGMRLIELHREIDDMAIATEASLHTIKLKEFDCGWTKWDGMFQKRGKPKFQVDTQPKDSWLWDVLKIMHMCGWLNPRCPKCMNTRHGGSCIHFRPCDLKALFNMRQVCFSWMCVVDAWLESYKIKKVVFNCTRCRVIGSKSKLSHLSQWYYTEKWEKTKIKLVNDYEMANEEFGCEFQEGHD